MMFPLDEKKPKPCRWCGKPVPPQGDNTSEYCNRNHYDLWRANRIPKSWRILHAWMKLYQQRTSKLPLMDEMARETPFAGRSGVLHALRKLAQRGYVRAKGDPRSKRRYRAVGTLPKEN